MAKSAVDTLVAKLDAEIAKLQETRAYILKNAGSDETPVATKARKPRTKRGMPKADENPLLQ